MAAETNIDWTDSTFNPWWGCTRISPGCDNCYAAALDHRLGGDHWGAKKAYRVLSENNWKNPVIWQRQAPAFFHEHGRKRRVFCASMADVFDNNAAPQVRERLWGLVAATPDLNWQILTKRPRNFRQYLPGSWPLQFDNVWLGVTVEDRKHGLPRISLLKQSAAHVKFLSIEPLIEDLGVIDLESIDWVIVGGESGNGARKMHRDWVISIREQCAAANVPFFFKQWGGIIGKGGCEIDGKEYKDWPSTIQTNILL